ncbi:MAG: flagellar hook-associated protein FlgK, partial [Lachnospiraceae bacterium]|nr:flagellar hook-associated protein FlgK [Lachnospiraceae bacterium]
TIEAIAPAIERDINYMNLAEEGVFTVNNKQYKYDRFDFTRDENGEIKSITFHLEDGLTSKEQEKMSGSRATVGETVAYKGVTYYQNQMNAFLRSFATELNDMQLKGIDYFGDDGQVLFTVNDITQNREGMFGAEGTLDSATGLTHYSCTDDSYYRLTAAGVMVNSDVLSDPRLLSATYKRYDEDGNILTDGQDSADLVVDMLKLEKEVPLFRGGGATSFLQCIYADITVDTQECSVFKDNYAAIEKQITTQRTSVSGVDEDEEALDLVKFQNAYNLNAKVISVLAEIYDQLILNTGV